MLTSINIGTAALAAFSKGLDTISNNVSNLNTIGYKGSQAQFAAQFSQERDAQGQQHSGAVGNGVASVANVVNFKAGDYAETGNRLQLAVDGNGFFILKDGDGRLSYTKNGDFRLKDGLLVSEAGLRVQGVAGDGTLKDITTNGFGVETGKPSQTIKYNAGLGSVLSTALTSNTTASPPFTVYDGAGGATQLSIVYTNVNPATSGTYTHIPGLNKWKVEVKDSTGAVIATDHVEFDVSGQPKAAHTSFAFNYTPRGAGTMPLTLSYANLTSNSSATSSSGIPVSADGYGRGGLTGAEFDESGSFAIGYSNSQSNKSQRIALALFDSTSGLRQVDGGTFVHERGAPPSIGGPGAGYGALKVGFLEKSNVDLSREFSDIILMQRGFQASTELISTANQMLGNLMDMKGRG